MSRATKRKHVLKEIVDDDYAPPTANQQIVRILKNCGNNLHQVETPDKTTFLVSMPQKFRRSVWVKRGDFVLVEPIKEGDKVKGEMVRILNDDHIKYYKQDNVWPEEFYTRRDAFKINREYNEDDLFVNTNRMSLSGESNQDSNSEESDDESGEESE